MYISPDDAQTDVILTAAVAVLGVSLRAFVVTLPLYPAPGLFSALLDLVWIVAITALVPWLLSRYRGDRLAAFGLGPGAGGLAAGLLVAVPVVLLGAGLQLFGNDPTGALLGRLAAPVGSPFGVLDVVIGAARVLLLSVGTLGLVAFLAVRGREGFSRSPEMHLTQLVRTIGLGAVVLAFVLGALGAIGPGSIVVALANAVALLAVLLLADRLIPTGISLSRSAIIAPVVVVTVAKMFATGGLIFGDLLTGFTTAALAMGVTLTIAGLAQTRRGVVAAIPLVVAAHWWPTCLSPLVLAGGIC